MAALGVALVFTFAVRDRLIRRGGLTRWSERALGATSLALWVTVAAAGRWVGFS